MAENVEDEVERYRRILEDWKPGPPPPKSRPQPALMTAPPSPATPSNGASLTRPNYNGNGSAGAEYSAGAILLLNQRTLAIYRKAVPEKGYHLVLALCPNHAVKAQGIALEGYQIEELGSLAPAWLERLLSEMRWERDLIVFHCYRYEDVARIPAVDHVEEPGNSIPAPVQWTQPVMPAQPPAPEPSAPAPAEKTNGQLRRGQRLQIQFGAKAWDAVYWGKDDQGQVIAHRTYENWSLMHLDLARFQNGLVVHPEVEPGLIKEIEDALVSA
jgi:hypothetical protein